MGRGGDAAANVTAAVMTVTAVAVAVDCFGIAIMTMIIAGLLMLL